MNGTRSERSCAPPSLMKRMSWPSIFTSSFDMPRPCITTASPPPRASGVISSVSGFDFSVTYCTRWGSK